MTVIIYGDFNCPYSYLASQRADLLSKAGVAVDWRAVEHDRRLPVTGSRPAATGLRGTGNSRRWPHSPCPASRFRPGRRRLISNTEAAVAAYAEAVSDGVADELRGSLFRAIWGRD